MTLTEWKELVDGDKIVREGDKENPYTVVKVIDKSMDPNVPWVFELRSATGRKVPGSNHRDWEKA